MNYRNLISLASTEAGRYLLGIDKSPIVKLTQNSVHQLIDRKTVRATFWINDQVSELIAIPQTKIEIARKYVKNDYEAFLHYSGLDIRYRYPQVYLTTDTFQPADGIDNFLSKAAATTNYGTNVLIQTQAYSETSNVKRPIITFDITSIANTHTVNSATLTLNMSANDDTTSQTTDIHKVTRSWTEAGSTWNTYDGLNNWGTAGGDFSVGNMGSTAVTVNAAYTWTLTASVVQEWLTTNNGMIIKANNEAANINNKSFDSSEATTAGNRPKLTVIYDVFGGPKVINFL